MCIAIVQPAGCKIKEDHLRNSFEGNSDGAGFAYVKEGKVVVEKGFMTLHPFLDRYEEIHETFGKEAPVLAHCRIATAGKISKDNCHPFRIKGGAMIHNGHLWNTEYDGEKSDTREFAEIFYNILDYDSIIKAVHSYDFLEIIGYDKMAFLYDDGRFTTAGDWVSDEDSGVLFSNRGYSSGRGHNPLASFNDDWDYDMWWDRVNGNRCMT